MTFFSETAALFGAEVEGRPSQYVAIYGSVGRLQNIAPTDVQDALDLVSLLSGIRVKASIPATYGIGGVKIGAPAGAVDVYGLAGGGIAYMTGKVSVADVDFSHEFLEFFSGEDLTAVKPMIEFGGGVGIPVGRMRFDASYRFDKPLQMGAPVNLSRVQVGVGVGF
jgi:hypothetical protein